MNQKDEHLDDLSHQLHKDGIGPTKIQARVVSVAEEEQLWSSGVIGAHDPFGLQNVVFCFIIFIIRNSYIFVLFKFIYS